MPDIASERFIVFSRISLAVGGLFAAWLDPAQPSQGDLGYVFLIAYVIFSLGLIATYSRPLRDPWGIIAHAFEIALVCLIIIYTEGPTSPFFIYFTFLLLVAALRWQWQGAVITGAVLSLVLIVLTISAFLVEFERGEIDRLIFRNIYLVVAAVLFAFLGDRLGRSRQQLERLRLARELHDGILQTLTAVRLKLETAAAGPTDRQREQLVEIGELLNDEQRQLRVFVEESRRSPAPGSLVNAVSLSSLRPMTRQLERLWGCKVELDTSLPAAPVSLAVAGAFKFIVAERVANAVTHGGADRIAINVSNGADALVVRIKDNGCGLQGADGEYDDAAMVAKGIGPRSIRERVASLHGSMRMITDATGTELQIQLPISRAG